MSLIDELEAVARAVFDPVIGVAEDVFAQAATIVPGGPAIQEVIEDVLPIPGPLSGNGLQTRVRTAPAVVDMTGFGGGNGRQATRTIVETMDLATGKIIRRKVMAGSPHLMNKDVSAAKKVFRVSAKLHGRMPRRTVKESKSKQLVEAATQAAISAVTCPPKKDC